MYATDVQSAVSAQDALARLAACEDGKFLAGGQTLIPAMKARLAAHSDLISLARAGLSGLRAGAGTITIGAMTTHAEVAASAQVQAACPGLAALAGGIGDPAVRNRGTIGGSIANNDPAADYPAALLALGATVTTNARSIPAAEFFAGLFETALEEDELITEVAFPVCAACAYAKFRQPASRFALTGVFLARTPAGIAVAVTGAGEDGVFRHAGLEAALDADFSPAAVDRTDVSADGLMADIHGSAAYRAALIKAMTKEAMSRL